jgi:hypothetical protein
MVPPAGLMAGPCLWALCPTGSPRQRLQAALQAKQQPSHQLRGHQGHPAGSSSTLASYCTFSQPAPPGMLPGPATTINALQC